MVESFVMSLIRIIMISCICHNRMLMTQVTKCHDKNCRLNLTVRLPSLASAAPNILRKRGSV